MAVGFSLSVRLRDSAAQGFASPFTCAATLSAYFTNQLDRHLAGAVLLGRPSRFFVEVIPWNGTI